ncbi:MAG: carboxy terminal-processing peptidase [Saprospiraceae bacterium]
MKKSLLIIGSVITAVGILFATSFTMKNRGGDPKEKEAMIVQTLISGLTNMHYSPKVIDDKFSKEVYHLYLDRLDNARRFFTQQDIAQLQKFQTLIDDETNAASYEFFDLSLQLLDKQLNTTQGYYREILAQPFDFSKDESIELDGKKHEYAKNDTELKDFWYKLLKYEVLNRIVDKEEAQDKGEKDENGVVPTKKTTQELEIDARKDVLKTFDDWYKRMFKSKRMDRLSDYLNCITNVYDPHTGYFEPKDKEKFDQDMSGKFEGIGARLQQEGEYVKVNEIIAGGPAWKQKELEVGDVIMKVAQANNEAVDIAGMDMDDAIKLIKGKKDTEVRLTVKKKTDGKTKVIVIIRDEVILEETFAKSLILSTNDGKEKIGYIKLPRFYADFENSNGSSCARDVATEVEKLKKENVKGLIIDLRNNGGGSLRDVVQMSGLFIKEGPIVQVKSREVKPEVLRDYDKEVQYDAPLIILVNQGSASASEIMAAALQDYGRAVIVGAKGTYGKGTVQRFIDLDRTISGHSDIKPLGEVKLTIQNFYRINGGSTQLRGVTPDIILPDNYNYLKVGEIENEHPLQWTEIAPATFEKTGSIKDLNKLKAASEARVRKNATFAKIEENAKRLKKRRDITKYSIEYKKHKKYDEELTAEAKKYEDMLKEIPDFVLDNPTPDKSKIESDSIYVARNQDWFKNVKKDIQLYESLNIIYDMIRQNSDSAGK